MTCGLVAAMGHVGHLSRWRRDEGLIARVIVLTRILIAIRRIVILIIRIYLVVMMVMIIVII